MTEPTQSRNELIESRINTGVAGALAMSELGVVFRSMAEVMEFAKMMAVSEHAVPMVFRGNPGACLAVAIKAHHLGFEPFSFASKCYLVNDQLAYEGQLIHAIITRRGPFVKRPTVSYSGEGQARKCHVILHMAEPDGDKEYESPELQKINPRKSPLWVSDPDQQLHYYSVRAAARRHCPDVILGMYDPEEMASIAAKDVTPAKPQVDIAAKLATGAAPVATYVERGAPVSTNLDPANGVLFANAPDASTAEAGGDAIATGDAATFFAREAPAEAALAEEAKPDTSGVRHDWALTAEIEEALTHAASAADLTILEAEFEAAISVASEQTRQSIAHMISARREQVSP